VQQDLVEHEQELKVQEGRLDEATAEVASLRDQRAQAEAEYRHKNLDDLTQAEQMPIFVHRLQEPGDIEAPGQFAKPCPAGHEKKLAVPLGLKLGALIYLRASGQWILNQNRILGDLAENQECTVAPSGNSRKRRVLEAHPAAFDHSRFKLQLPGTAQHLGNGETDAAEFMGKLGRIGGNAMKPEKQNQ